METTFSSKKGSRRSWSSIIGAEEGIEHQLNDEFKDSELRIQDLPNIEVGDYAVVEEDIVIADANTPSSINLDFQNPAAPFTIEL